MGGGHVLDHKNVPGKTFGGVGEFSRDLVSEFAKVTGKLLGGVFVGEDYGEVDVAGAGEAVALGFHASEDVAVGVGWGGHFLSPLPGLDGVTFAQGLPRGLHSFAALWLMVLGCCWGTQGPSTCDHRYRDDRLRSG